MQVSWQETKQRGRDLVALSYYSTTSWTSLVTSRVVFQDTSYYIQDALGVYMSLRAIFKI